MCSAIMRQVFDGLYLCRNVDILPEGGSYKMFTPDVSIQYYPICDDFGPLNMSSIIKFVEQLQSELEGHPSCILFYSVGSSQRELTNAKRTNQCDILGRGIHDHEIKMAI